jgi:flavin reductase (DIM6/NTAB) family NADH-FMN oxidoreductase RutF
MSIHYKTDQIKNLDKFYRANLINSIIGIKQASLIGTLSSKNTSNLAIFSSGVHLGSNPALIGIFSRPKTNHPRQTMENILLKKQFTLNHVNLDILKKSHATSYKFGEFVSEFKNCNLKERYIQNFNAPFVEAAEIAIGLQYLNNYKIIENGVVMIVGEIQHIIIRNSDYLLENGEINFQSSKSVGVGGNNTYYKLKYHNTLDYISSTEEFDPEILLD